MLLNRNGMWEYYEDMANYTKSGMLLFVDI